MSRKIWFRTGCRSAMPSQASQRSIPMRSGFELTWAC